MNEKEINTKEFKIIHMYDADISTEDKPIIGTDALATCIGVLLYNEKNKQAIVAHAAPEQFEIVKQILDLVEENNWDFDSTKYKIISGYYEEHYNTKAFLEEIFSILRPFKDSEISKNAIMVNDKLECKYFAFDSRIGKFITEKVYFGEDYYKINNGKKNK